MMKKALPAPLDLPPSPACAGFGRAGLAIGMTMSKGEAHRTV